MAVCIRMKKMGRTHRAFFRICAFDRKAPRDGRALEELGTYDPSVADVDARALLKRERIDYWLSVGAQPSEKVAVLIKKYGANGTHVEAQRQALERLAKPRVVPAAGPPVVAPKGGKSAGGSGADGERDGAGAPPGGAPDGAPDGAPASSAE